MDIQGKATRIELLNIKQTPMRVFHITWFSFFLSFFAWFGIAPLMPIIRDELGLTKGQIGNIIIASVAATVFARLVIGALCDRFGPRRTYGFLLIFGAIPVMGVGLAQDYLSLLLFRLAIGGIGAGFVITQYHTSMMFAPNVVGTANATTAGWGNLGGGVTQIVMPLVFAGFLLMGASEAVGWRLAMVVPGIALMVMGFVYLRYTTDFPNGNMADLRARGELPKRQRSDRAEMFKVIRDRRVWALFVVYAACFGVELTINNIAALYYHDEFGLSVATAGLVAGLFGMMNIFARTLGGYFGDRFGNTYGLNGRVWFLGAVLIAEGLALMAFSQMRLLPVAIASMLVFSLFVQMAEGATFSVVPFVNKKALGLVSGIVGAGGNVGAVMAGVLFGLRGVSTSSALLYIGMFVAGASFLTLLIRFAPAAAGDLVLPEPEVAMAPARVDR